MLFINGIGADIKNPVGAANSPLPKHFTVLAFDPLGLGDQKVLQSPSVLLIWLLFML